VAKSSGSFKPGHSVGRRFEKGYGGARFMSEEQKARAHRIRAMLADGMPNWYIAEKEGVSASTVSHYKTGKRGKSTANEGAVLPSVRTAAE
jgi:DNA-binding NarL/FixJ family response regulator